LEFITIFLGVRYPHEREYSENDNDSHKYGYQAKNKRMGTFAVTDSVVGHKATT